MAAINWGTEGLTTYLGTLNDGAGIANAATYTTLINRLTTIYPEVQTEDGDLVNLMSGAIRDILEICGGTWTLSSGAQTTAATVLTWIQTNRPDISSTYGAVLDDIVATDINTTLMPSTITSPTTITIDSKNVYLTGVANLLTNLNKWLRHYGHATSEDWTTSKGSTPQEPSNLGAPGSSSYGSYVGALPETIY